MITLKERTAWETGKFSWEVMSPEEVLKGALQLGVSRPQLEEIVADISKEQIERYGKNGFPWDGWSLGEYLKKTPINWSTQCKLMAMRMLHSGSGWDIFTERELRSALEEQFRPEIVDKVMEDLPVKWDLMVLPYRIALEDSGEVKAESDDLLAYIWEQYPTMVKDREMWLRAIDLLETALTDVDSLNLYLKTEYHIPALIRERLCAGVSKGDSSEILKKNNWVRAVQTSTWNAYVNQCREEIFDGFTEVKMEDPFEEDEVEPEAEGTTEVEEPETEEEFQEEDEQE